MEDFFNAQFDIPGRFAGWGGRVQRGDMSFIVLDLLKDQSLHGYEIIRKLEERSAGVWRPSAGSIYPTLQLLEDQEFVTSSDANGKKVYTITTAGLEELKKRGDRQIPWEHKRKNHARFGEFGNLARDIAHTLRNIMKHGSEEQMNELRLLLEETREKMNKINLQ